MNHSLRWKAGRLVEPSYRQPMVGSARMSQLLSIGEVSRRSGVASSALRFYEDRGLIGSERAGSGHRRYPRPVLRRIAFIVFAQRIGLTLDEIGLELAKLPSGQVPSRRDWSRLSRTLDRANRAADHRAPATPARSDRVHRLRLSVTRPLCAGQSRRSSRRARSRPALPARRSSAGITRPAERFGWRYVVRAVAAPASSVRALAASARTMSARAARVNADSA